MSEKPVDLMNLIYLKLEKKIYIERGWEEGGAEIPKKFDGSIWVYASEVGGSTNEKPNKKQTCAQKFHLVDVGEYLAWDSDHVTSGKMYIHVEYVSCVEILIFTLDFRFFNFGSHRAIFPHRFHRNLVGTFHSDHEHFSTWNLLRIAHQKSSN